MESFESSFYHWTLSVTIEISLSFFFFFPPFPPPSFRELLFPLKSRYTLFFFHQNDEANLNEKGDR